MVHLKCNMVYFYVPWYITMYMVHFNVSLYILNYHGTLQSTMVYLKCTMVHLHGTLMYHGTSQMYHGTSQMYIGIFKCTMVHFYVLYNISMVDICVDICVYFGVQIKTEYGTPSWIFDILSVLLCLVLALCHYQCKKTTHFCIFWCLEKK